MQPVWVDDDELEQLRARAAEVDRLEQLIAEYRAEAALCRAVVRSKGEGARTIEVSRLLADPRLRVRCSVRGWSSTCAQ